MFTAVNLLHYIVCQLFDLTLSIDIEGDDQGEGGRDGPDQRTDW